MKRIFIYILLLMCMGLNAQSHYAQSQSRRYASGDSTILAEVWYMAENNAADSSGNARDAIYAGSYDAGIYKQGSYAFEFETADVLTYGSFTWNDTFAICFWYYHEDTESENGRAYLAKRGNDTNGWTLEFDQINGDIEFHKFVSSTSYETRTVNGFLTTRHDQWLCVIVQVVGSSLDYYIYVNDVDRTSSSSTNSADYQTGDITMGTGVNSTVDVPQIYNFLLTSAQRTFVYNNPGSCLKELL